MQQVERLIEEDHPTVQALLNITLADSKAYKRTRRLEVFPFEHELVAHHEPFLEEVRLAFFEKPFQRL